MLLNHLKQFDYLAKEWNSGKKHKPVEWIALIRVALLELDNAIGHDIVSIEGNETTTGPEFQKYLERIGANVNLAKMASPLFAEKGQDRRKTE